MKRWIYLVTHKNHKTIIKSTLKFHFCNTRPRNAQSKYGAHALYAIYGAAEAAADCTQHTRNPREHVRGKSCTSHENYCYEGHDHSTVVSTRQVSARKFCRKMLREYFDFRLKIV